MKFGTREHCSGLKESLKTTIYITQEEFQKKAIYYHYYGYDERCKQFLFIKIDFRAKKQKQPLWLFIELDKEQEK